MSKPVFYSVTDVVSIPVANRDVDGVYFMRTPDGFKLYRVADTAGRELIELDMTLDDVMKKNNVTKQSIIVDSADGVRGAIKPVAMKINTGATGAVVISHATIQSSVFIDFKVSFLNNTNQIVADIRAQFYVISGGVSPIRGSAYIVTNRNSLLPLPVRAANLPNGDVALIIGSETDTLNWYGTIVVEAINTSFSGGNNESFRSGWVANLVSDLTGYFNVTDLEPAAIANQDWVAAQGYITAEADPVYTNDKGNIVMYKGQLPANSTHTLDDYKENGVFVQAGNASASLAQGYPEAKAGILTVRGNLASHVIQEYNAYASTNIYRRYYYATTGVWTGWVKILTSTDGRTYVSTDPVADNAVLSSYSNDLHSVNGNTMFWFSGGASSRPPWIAAGGMALNMGMNNGAKYAITIASGWEGDSFGWMSTENNAPGVWYQGASRQWALAQGWTANQTDAYLLNRANHTGTQAISTVSGLQGALNDKVDKITGKGLSTEDYTTAEKAKLAGLESSHFQGQFTSVAALVAAGVEGIGNYAYVDAGPGIEAKMYIWDDDNGDWIEQAGASTAETPATIKAKYESNPDTNAYTDADKTKLGGLTGDNLGNADMSVSANRTVDMTIKELAFVNGTKYRLHLNGGDELMAFPGALYLKFGASSSRIKLNTAGVSGGDKDVAFQNQSGTIALLSDIPTGLPPSGAAGGELDGTYPNPIIRANAVSNAKLNEMPANTIKCNNTTVTAEPQDVDMEELLGLSALGITRGGTTLTGDGNSTSFVIPHDLGVSPGSATVTPGDPDAALILAGCSIDLTITNIVIKLNNTPGNLVNFKVYWIAIK